MEQEIFSEYEQDGIDLITMVYLDLLVDLIDEIIELILLFRIDQRLNALGSKKNLNLFANIAVSPMILFC